MANMQFILITMCTWNCIKVPECNQQFHIFWAYLTTLPLNTLKNVLKDSRFCSKQSLNQENIASEGSSNTHF